MKCRWTLFAAALSAAPVLALLASGCATTQSQMAADTGFVGQPVEEDRPPLAPAPSRPIEDLLKDASEALQLANESQEAGDPEAARRHYTLMLELLIEADLDPEVFYALREPLENIVDASAKEATRFARPEMPVYPAEPYLGSMMSDLPIPDPLPYRVVRELERIQNDYPDSFQRGLDRSQQYLPYIEAEFEKAGLPKDLAWLAIVESNFWPTAVSRASAGGMWQFMKGTALQYNLRVDGSVDNWVDERFDWQSATRAAIEYLQSLYVEFDGNWPLAVSAYNMGEGGLERAIAQNNGERDLWTLLESPPASNRIPLETKQYYPRLIASIIVAKNPEKYGFHLDPVTPVTLTKVPVKGMYDLYALEKELGYAKGALVELNPSLLRHMTPPEHTGEYAVTVPEADRRRFTSALRNVTPLKYGNMTHQVARGETFSQIASRYKVSWTELMRLNGYSSATSLRVGKVLRIPGYHTPGAPAPTSVASSAPAPAATYTVRRGDTLYDIAQAHGTTIKTLQAWNGIGSNSRLQIGEKLKVRAPEAKSVSTPVNPQYHVVKANEYASKIAKNYGLSLDAFLKMNNMTSRSKIYAGQKVIVGAAKSASASAPSPATSAAAPISGNKIEHTVGQGETAGGIAEKYGVSLKDFLAWNDLNSSSVLHIGDRHVVYLSGDAPVAASSEDETPAKKIHVVTRGQNPTTIAQANGVSVDDLFKWNSWSKRHVLQIGDEVVIYTK